MSDARVPFTSDARVFYMSDQGRPSMFEVRSIEGVLSPKQREFFMRASKNVLCERGKRARVFRDRINLLVSSYHRDTLGLFYPQTGLLSISSNQGLKPS